jgi:hypothetical protein
MVLNFVKQVCPGVKCIVFFFKVQEPNELKHRGPVGWVRQWTLGYLGWATVDRSLGGPMIKGAQRGAIKRLDHRSGQEL